MTGDTVFSKIVINNVIEKDGRYPNMHVRCNRGRKVFPKGKSLLIGKMSDPFFSMTQTELFIRLPIPVTLIKLRFFICLKMTTLHIAFCMFNLYLK